MNRNRRIIFVGERGTSRIEAYPMDNIARLNIAHFRAMLVAEQGEAKRLILRRLLAEEEVKLATLHDPPIQGTAKGPGG
jgi:hypothetical protein